MERKQQPLQTEEATPDASKLLEHPLLATKFFAPVTSGVLVSRPRLMALLHQSLKYPLTVISAPAGFGKTTLLSAWGQSLPARTPKLAWVSLDEEDNEPRLFWTYILTALNREQPKRFTPLLMQQQSLQALPLKYLLTALINLLAEETEQSLLILDDYQVIIEQQVHSTFSYLLEHLPPQLHIILSTRTDPPLPLSQLRAHQQLLEVHTEQLRCTTEETGAFFKMVVGMPLPDETIQQVATRTEGWLVGLQLLSLSQPEWADPLKLLEEVSGNQRYILDYLTEEVLRQQPQDIQMFLLSTSIIEKLSTSLCDAVMGQPGSQQMLRQLEQANLFVMSLDSKRKWYRYHMLFAEALRSCLEQSHADLMPSLHSRASIWYAQHNQITQAILHAFSAKEWQWAADLIERIPVVTLTEEVGEHELARLQHWLGQLPADIVHSRPRLCLACTQLLWSIAPYPIVQTWLDAAEAVLTATLTMPTGEDASHTMLTPQARQEQADLLGEVFTCRAFLGSFKPDGQGALALCQQAFSLLSAENSMIRARAYWALLRAYYISSANDAAAAIQSGLQGGMLAQEAGYTALAISIISTTACFMIGAGQLHEAQQLIKEAIQLETQPKGPVLIEIGWTAVFQAEILREWNKLDEALSLAEEGISLYKQTRSIASITYLLYGYAVLLRICLSRRELDAARSALQQIEHIGRYMNQSWYIYLRAFFTTIDQVRLWLACGELSQATHWAENLDIAKQHGTPFAHEREEVACVRVLLAMASPTLALERLESVLQRAITGKRWGHVTEIRLLQALAHQMCHEEAKALSALSEAVSLAEPQGYIRSFVDEGTPIEALLYRLRKQDRKKGPTPYLDMLLAAFQQENMAHIRTETGEPAKAQPLPESLSMRELEVLQLLAQGVSNLEIAQELVIALDTVKRHISHIFSKLGVQNRVQAVKQAQALGLLDKEA